MIRRKNNKKDLRKTLLLSCSQSSMLEFELKKKCFDYIKEWILDKPFKCIKCKFRLDDNDNLKRHKSWKNNYKCHFTVRKISRDLLKKGDISLFLGVKSLKIPAQTSYKYGSNYLRNKCWILGLNSHILGYMIVHWQLRDCGRFQPT